MIGLDCGWQNTSRTSNGTFQWNPAVIPGGVPALASFVHGLGMKFGVYSDACAIPSLESSRCSDPTPGDTFRAISWAVPAG